MQHFNNLTYLVIVTKDDPVIKKLQLFKISIRVVTNLKLQFLY